MIIQVAVPFRVPKLFDYKIADADADRVVPGSLVQVPFGSRLTHAFVLGFSETSTISDTKLKSVEAVLNESPVFDEKMLEFLRWVSAYYCHPLGETIATAVPKDSWRVRKRKTRAITSDPTAGLRPAHSERFELTPEQKQVLDEMDRHGHEKPYLLFGVTGSGKTEVYMNAIERFLNTDQSAIVLAPEISLTPQLVGRFSDRFPGQTAVLHSHLSPAERQREWKRAASGEARIVVGARSAVFAPVKNLALIIVDEEQEASFKQEDSLRYNARDIAVVRAKICGARVVLGSATPSLESYTNAKNEKFHLLTLKKRVLDRPLPQCQFVDIKNNDQLVDSHTPWFSKPLFAKIQDTIQNGQQVLLYLNRLGYAHFLFCHDCGHTEQCRNCDISLTYYRTPPRLKCHYCGASQAPPQTCSQCSGTHIIPMGVGTEQVEQALKHFFPKARIARMDRSVIKNRKDLEEVLQRVADGRVDIVIGTQMIAKGHDFPGIALVGILLADASLNIPDFRANERTFQILTQVAGRAGRAGHAGEVLIQTLNPDHWVLRAAAEHRSEDFYREESHLRQMVGFPPATRLALLRFQHSNPGTVRRFVEETVATLAKLPGAKKCDIVGPAEAPLAKVKKLYRWQCLVKCSSAKELRALLIQIQQFVDRKKSPVQFAVDVDPVTLW
ncbi:MAG: primosomal protein N' [Bdellovibrionales bacterium]|nr:primosomal protein N' [Bdellovibrionales bacterium]